MKKRIIGTMAVLAAGAVALTGCAGAGAEPGGGDGELSGLTGEIGAKDFAEQYILAYMTAELLNANGADVEANIKLVGSANVRQALENDQFLGYWEYTGTSWITYNGNTSPVVGVPEQFEAVKEADAEHGIAWLDGAPFNNTYAFAIRSSERDALGVDSLSDVAALPAEDQTFCIESEFSTRDDGWPGLAGAYGFAADDSNGLTMLDTGVIYTATQKGDDCNFGEVFQTDGRISALDLVVMEDDQNFFPAYQGAFTLKQATLDEFPAIADVMAELSPLLTTEVMQSLNQQVDVDGEDPEDVAIAWLEEQGLI
ncbi:MAG: glycine betaine ABC transporter substrate-binding protein [Homoserinimonas sp.]